jgi:hypothetical protein
LGLGKHHHLGIVRAPSELVDDDIGTGSGKRFNGKPKYQKKGAGYFDSGFHKFPWGGAPLTKPQAEARALGVQM